jgi:hypothetical protein
VAVDELLFLVKYNIKFVMCHNKLITPIKILSTTYKEINYGIKITVPLPKQENMMTIENKKRKVGPQ